MPSPRFAANVGTLFTELALERRFEAAAQAGFAAVEHGNPYTLPAPRYRRLLDEAGVACVLINSPVGPVGTASAAGWGCQPDDVPAFRAGVAKALDYAAELGCQLVHLRAGVPEPSSSPAVALDQFTTNASRAAEQAGSHGVRLTIEALNRVDAPGYLIDSVDRAAAVVRAVGSDRLGVQFDVYHCVRSGDFGQHDGLRGRVADIADVLTHVQIADVPGRHEPGTGRIAFAELFAALDEVDYQGWIGCEYVPLTSTFTGLGWRTTGYLADARHMRR